MKVGDKLTVTSRRVATHPVYECEPDPLEARISKLTAVLREIEAGPKGLSRTPYTQAFMEGAAWAAQIAKTALEDKP